MNSSVAVGLKNELKLYLKSEIAKFESKIADCQSGIVTFQSEITKFESKIVESKSEIAKLSKVLNEEIDSRIDKAMGKEESKAMQVDDDEKQPFLSKEEIANEEMTEMEQEASNEMKKDVDADKMYNDAFAKSGGEAALIRYKGVSDSHRKKVNNETIGVELDKLLPPSMNWNGRSKFLVNQSYVRSIEELYENAEGSHTKFKIAMNEIAAKTKNARADVPGLKTRQRAIEKSKFKYIDEDGKGGVAYYRLTDIVRGTLVFDNIPDMYESLTFVQDCNHFEIIEFNDRFQKRLPNAGAYRDLQLTVKLKATGFLCELQMSTKLMIDAKQAYGHRDYEVYRRLESAVKDRDLEQIESTLAFCEEQLGSKYRKSKKILPLKCHELVHTAAVGGDADILDRLIEYGADVNTRDENGNTPLHHAVFHGHERCVWLLLDKHECNPILENNNKETALMTGYVKYYTQPSEQARRAIATLLQKTDHADVVKTSTEFQSIVQDRLVPRRELVDSAASGDIEKMRVLLREYTNPNSDRDGTTALEEAVKNKHKEAVALLIQFGVSISRNTIALALHEDYGISKILISHGISRPDLLPQPDVIDCGVNGKNKWEGMVCWGTKLFCVPHCASDILVVDAETETIRFIPCGVEGDYKWSGIACCGSKLFCAPSHASDILVIDAETEEIHFIPCGVEGDWKWKGIACYGNKLFCAPHWASHILVIDTLTENIHTIPCGVEGVPKWLGIACCCTKLFCAPFHANDILVIDAITEETHTIPCGVGGVWKWDGIACHGTKLFCAPRNAIDILVIDAETEKTHTIPCGVEGKYKWSGIACYGTKLFCAPFEASDILVIDATTEETRTIPCGEKGELKWHGVSCYGTKLFFAPFNSNSILVHDDVLRTPKALQEALNHADFEMAKSHISRGVRSSDILPSPSIFECKLGGWRSWYGIACFGTKLFCAPFHASCVLVIDTETDRTYGILSEVKGVTPFCGIACCGKKLFCAPCNANNVLVIDGASEETYTIPCEVEGKMKWRGIACCGSKLFCAPYDASDILVINAETQETYLLPCGVEGLHKWQGIACHGAKLFCAPLDADCILVIDAITEETHTIPCEVEGERKWIGIACYGSKLFCAPFNASEILVIDAITEETHTVPCGVEGRRKWKGIACYGTNLFCAPYDVSGILVIDGESEETRTIPCGVDGDRKYTSIASYGTRLFCAPQGARDILVLEDRLAELESSDNVAIHSECKKRPLLLGNDPNDTEEHAKRKQKV